ncbi:tetratricopeptide repeat domain-containing protein [Sarocladium implicatum]|nr:tetratricopeptide repeat domain-containing protein [Sarocladium implicatum]
MLDTQPSSEYYDLGSFHRPVTTTSPDAQTWFNRGLVWSYGFNHEEAVRCFEKAISYDPKCAIAYWGLAYALGPNYNKPWSLFSKKEAVDTISRTHDAIRRAREAAKELSPSSLERQLLDALAQRYPMDQEPSKTNCSTWNRDYADAMAKVYADFPNDLDVATLYADAMMNLTPWQLWELDTGKPASMARTLEIKKVLDRALAREDVSEHPGILHLYIHLMEMSTTPEEAKPAADRLRRLVPDAGHLVHMPSHYDILVGDYNSAVEANAAAVVADERFLAREGPMNFYTLYRCHDYHFLLYAAMLAGQSKVALEAVTKLEATISEDILRIEQPPMADWLESFLAMRVHAYVRFGRWSDLIDMPLPKDQDLYCVTTALIHYAKGLALAARGRVAEAEEQRSLFLKAVPRVKPTRTLFNNKCVDILGVAQAMLDGELEYRRGNYESAFAHLRDSISRYDSLPFDEPWGWMQPTRHAYGALLLEQGHAEEALGVYAADLGLNDTLPRAHRHPKNVWALHGYHECLVRLGRAEEADEIKPALREAQKVADVRITSSCFCRRHTMKL